MAKQPKASVSKFIKDELEYLSKNGCEGVSLAALGRQTIDGLLLKENALGPFFKAAGCQTDDDKRNAILNQIYTNQEDIMSVKKNGKAVMVYGEPMSMAALKEAFSKDSTIELSEDLQDMDRNQAFRNNYPVRYQYEQERFRKLAESVMENMDTGTQLPAVADGNTGVQASDAKDGKTGPAAEGQPVSGSDGPADDADTGKDDGNPQKSDQPAEPAADDGDGKDGPKDDPKDVPAADDGDGKDGPKSGPKDADEPKSETAANKDTAKKPVRDTDAEAAAAADEEAKKKKADGKQDGTGQPPHADDAGEDGKPAGEDGDKEEEGAQDAGPDGQGRSDGKDSGKKDGEKGNGNQGQSSSNGGSNGNSGGGSADAHKEAYMANMEKLKKMLEEHLISQSEYEMGCKTLLVNSLIQETNASVKAMSDISSYLSKTKDGTIRTWWIGRSFRKERDRHAKIAAEAARQFNDLEESLLTGGAGFGDRPGMGHRSPVGGIFSGIKSKIGNKDHTVSGSSEGEKEHAEKGRRGAGGTIRKAAGAAVVIGGAVGRAVFKSVHPIMWVKDVYNDIRNDIASARKDNQKPENAKDKEAVAQQFKDTVSDPESTKMSEGAKDFATSQAAMIFKMQEHMLETMKAMQDTMAKQSELMDKMSQRFAGPSGPSTEDVISSVEAQASERDAKAAEDAKRARAAAKKQDAGKQSGDDGKTADTAQKTGDGKQSEGDGKETGTDKKADAGKQSEGDGKTADTAQKTGDGDQKDTTATHATAPADDTQKKDTASEPTAGTDGAPAAGAAAGATEPTDSVSNAVTGAPAADGTGTDAAEKAVSDQARKNADMKASTEKTVDPSKLIAMRQAMAETDANNARPKENEDGKSVV